MWGSNSRPGDQGLHVLLTRLARCSAICFFILTVFVGNQSICLYRSLQQMPVDPLPHRGKSCRLGTLTSLPHLTLTLGRERCWHQLHGTSEKTEHGGSSCVLFKVTRLVSRVRIQTLVSDLEAGAVTMVTTSPTCP